MQEQPELFYEDELDLKEVFKAFQRQRKGFFAIILAGLLITAFLVLTSPRNYSTNSMLLVTPLKVQMAVSGNIMQGEMSSKSRLVLPSAISLETHQQLLLSEEIMSKLYYNLSEKGLIDKDKILLKNFFKMLDVEQVKDTDILILKVNAPTHDLAIAIANEWASLYLKYNQELLSGEFKGAKNFIAQQFEASRRKFLDLKDEAESFDIREDLTRIQNEYNAKKDKMDGYIKQVVNLQIELTEKRSQLQRIDALLKGFEVDGKWIGLALLENKGDAGAKLNQAKKALLEVSKRYEAAVNELTLARQKFPKAVWEKEIENVRNKIAQLSVQVDDLQSNIIMLRSDLANNARLSKFAAIGLLLPDNISTVNLWRILSLLEGYNFFVSRRDSLMQEYNDLQDRLLLLKEKLKEAGLALPEYELQLNVAQSSYQKYKDDYAAMKAKRDECKLAILQLGSRIEMFKQLADDLKEDVFQLNKQLVEKKRKKTKLDAELNLYNNTYQQWAKRLVENRIAKAMQLGDVKIVSKAVSVERKRAFGRIKALISMMFFGFIAVLYVFIKEMLSDQKEQKEDGN